MLLLILRNSSLLGICIFICRHVTLLINKSELDKAPDGPKVDFSIHFSKWIMSQLVIFYDFDLLYVI